MGLSQTIKFSAKTNEKINLLNKLGYKKKNGLFFKEMTNGKIEMNLTNGGLLIHRSGDYFCEFGLLIESLGNITTEITISDYP